MHKKAEKRKEEIKHGLYGTTVLRASSEQVCYESALFRLGVCFIYNGKEE